MKNICIFTGSSEGNAPQYMAAARALGSAIGGRGMSIVYGGATIGLMGGVADACLEAGGPVIGVMPRALAELEIVHKGLTEQHIVASMHERKAIMAERSDGFIALPGGLGTLDELFEIWTWGQLGEHAKPVALLNVEGFFDPLLAYLDSVVEQGFIKSEHRHMLIVGKSPAETLSAMAAYAPPEVPKLINPSET
jgi:hypothetical protein